MRKVRVAVGSTNPQKVEATKEAFQLVFSQVEAEFSSLPIQVSVSTTPSSDEEMIRGAVERATKAREMLGADVGVGVEGGFAHNHYGTFLKAWVVVVQQDGQVGIGSTPAIELPKAWQKQVDDDNELGDVMSKIANRPNIKQAEGAFGFLTDNLITRRDSLRLALISAFSALKKGTFYSKD